VSELYHGPDRKRSSKDVEDAEEKKGGRGTNKSRRRRSIARRMKMRERRSKCCHNEHKEMYQAYRCRQ
jgi:hypothetical protein